MRVGGIRGATTVETNTRESILEAALELLSSIMDANGLERDDVASVVFSATPDIDAVCPGVAARGMGWLNVALLCTQEMYVPGSLPMCLRILMHVNTPKTQPELQFIYLKGARELRPDLVKES